MKIDTNSNNIHVFRVNRPINKKRHSQMQDMRSNETNSACSRTSLSAETKRSICEHHISNPKCTQESLAMKFGCKRSTIAKIIKSKERWLSIDTDTATAKRFRQRNSRFPLVENALKLWLQKEQDNLAGVTDQMLRYQARQYAQAFSIEDDFKASSSWITNFKQRYISETDSLKKNTDPQPEDFNIEPNLHNAVKKFTTVFAIDSPESIDHPIDSSANTTPSPIESRHSVEQRSPSLSLSLNINTTTHDIMNKDMTEPPEDEPLIEDDIPVDEDTNDYTDTLDTSDIPLPETFMTEPAPIPIREQSSPKPTKTNMTKLNAKRHLEAALAFYNSQTGGSSSMSANMIKLILQNDF